MLPSHRADRKPGAHLARHSRTNALPLKLQQVHVLGDHGSQRYDREYSRLTGHQRWVVWRYLARARDVEKWGHDAG